MPKYTIIKAIGRGAFGEVLLGEDPDTGAQVAIKQVFVKGGDESGVPVTAQRECDTLRRVRHPHVVALLDVYTQGSSMYMVQELCTTDLGALLEACYDRPPPAVAKALVLHLLQGLAACHAAGVMHRDVKPGNLLLHPRGALQLADFGLARAMGEPAAAAAAEVGQPAVVPAAGAGAAGSSGPGLHAGQYSHGVATRWYRAPELLYGARVYGPAVDVWAAGMVMAEVLGLAPLVPGASDIDQLARLQQTLGTITTRDWPEAAALPDWGKLCFADTPGRPLAQLLPGAPPAALDLLGQMLRYPPYRRPTAEQALRHPYFSGAPAAAGEAEVAAFASRALARHAAAQARLRAGLQWQRARVAAALELARGAQREQEAGVAVAVAAHG